MNNREFKLEELWDYIAGNIGFDNKGRTIQNAIRKFIKLKIDEEKRLWMRELEKNQQEILETENGGTR